MKRETDLGSIFTGILYFILGVVFVAATEELLKTFNYILVCICAVIGVLQMISFFLNRKYKEGKYVDLFVAVVFLWVSLILYIYYGFMINILPILFSLYLFVMAMDLFIRYLELKGVVNVSRRKYLILSVIAVVVGLLLIFNPGGVILTYLKVTGGYLILVSILYFMDYFKGLRRN